MTIDELRPDDSIFLGPTLKDLIWFGGWRQRDIANRMHIDVSIISLWMRDQRPVPHNRLDSLAEALDTTVDALLENARIGRYSNETRGPDRGMPDTRPLLDRIPPPVEPAPAPAPPRVPASTVPLAWCDRSHGGPYRRHHHGVRSPLAPVGTLAGWCA